ncbi:SRPBCC family protein [Aurantibacter crassamenti]|uniref:SRPBCC family protein n=1 Tax=Aurantibacter crassamenti TaxID=1837375 RepID=UPI0019393AB6|nr:SRPBCC family protein [Aurantibacter crassamenti]MBM1107565.1 SRPBCC family protein [Aurantibacter crassamenti]
MYIAMYIIIAIVAIVILLALAAPKTYNVSRSIEVKRPKQEVFDYLLSLKNMDDWSPWAKKDPNMVKTFTGTDGEVGCISHWVGNKDVGEGEQEIKRITNGEQIDSELRFLKPWKSTSDCYLKVVETAAAATKVTWGFSGKNKFPMSIMTLFMSMDKMVGKDFEEGLASLKSVLEK